MGLVSAAPIVLERCNEFLRVLVDGLAPQLVVLAVLVVDAGTLRLELALQSLSACSDARDFLPITAITDHNPITIGFSQLN